MDDIPVRINPNSTKFIPRLRLFIRKKGLAYTTEKTYIHWIKEYIKFHRFRRPEDMGQRK